MSEDYENDFDDFDEDSPRQATKVQPPAINSNYKYQPPKQNQAKPDWLKGKHSKFYF